ncbi:hypothetical protein FHX41_2497 [Actinomadura hallensis]|uniref:Uncharacterized protein n=1 Tax=Actinomadura hallensis TaxID=337895 RepID=A0A543IE13_9ACTN|nr:hypothetical protein FHX41_2497 [Actinomadura hallensis]
MQVPERRADHLAGRPGPVQRARELRPAAHRAARREPSPSGFPSGHSPGMPQTGPSHTSIPTSGPRWSASCMISAWTGPAVSTRPTRESRIAPGEAASAAAERIRAMRLRHPSPGRPRSSVTASARAQSRETRGVTPGHLAISTASRRQAPRRGAPRRSYDLLGPVAGRTMVNAGCGGGRAVAELAGRGARAACCPTPARAHARPAAPPPHKRTHGPLPHPRTSARTTSCPTPARAHARPAAPPRHERTHGPLPHPRTSARTTSCPTPARAHARPAAPPRHRCRPERQNPCGGRPRERPRSVVWATGEPRIRTPSLTEWAQSLTGDTSVRRKG